MMIEYNKWWNYSQMPKAIYMSVISTIMSLSHVRCSIVTTHEAIEMIIREWNMTQKWVFEVEEEKKQSS
jgi:hypothetical protein